MAQLNDGSNVKGDLTIEDLLSVNGYMQAQGGVTANDSITTSYDAFLRHLKVHRTGAGTFDISPTSNKGNGLTITRESDAGYGPESRLSWIYDNDTADWELIKGDTASTGEEFKFYHEGNIESQTQTQPIPNMYTTDISVDNAITLSGSTIQGATDISSIGYYWEELVDKHVVGGSVLDETIDISQLPSHAEIMIRFNLTNSSGGAGTNLSLTIDGAAAAGEYEYVERAGATISEATAQSEFRLIQMGGSSPVAGTFILCKNDTGVGDQYATRPSIYGNGGSRGISRPALDYGSISTSSPLSYSTIEIYTNHPIDAGTISVFARTV